VEVPGNLSALLAIFSRSLAACVTVPRCHLVAVTAEKKGDENERETRAQRGRKEAESRQMSGYRIKNTTLT